MSNRTTILPKKLFNYFVTPSFRNAKTKLPKGLPTTKGLRKNTRYNKIIATYRQRQTKHLRVEIRSSHWAKNNWTVVQSRDKIVTEQSFLPALGLLTRTRSFVYYETQ